MLNNQTKQYLFDNHSGSPDLIEFHGKAILMDADHSHAPFPVTFLIHEQRVRGFWPFAQPTPIQPSIPFPQQNWIISDAQDVSAGSEISGTGPSFVPMKKEGSGDLDETICDQPSDTMSFTLDAESIEKILFATRNSESWKACVREGTSWEGTAEENVAKYKDSVF